MLLTECDVRVYTAAGLRKSMPPDWFSGIEFTYSNKGGWEQGKLDLSSGWNPGLLQGNEYIDIWLYGVRVFRGWPRIIEHETRPPEGQQLTLYGFMHLLEGILVNRHYTFADYATPDVIFNAICYDYVSPNFSVILDDTGLSAMTVGIRDYDGGNKSVTQCFNDIMDTYPNTMLWGCTVNSLGQNVIYFLPQPTNVKYQFWIDGQVVTYSVAYDATKICNRLRVDGGKVWRPQTPNLIPNGSFEEADYAGEDTSNLLTNGSFEETVDGQAHPPYWTVINDPTWESNYGHTGSNALRIDNNPTPPEGVWQDVYVQGALPVAFSCWADVQTGQVASYFVTMEAFDGSGTSLGTYTSPTQTLDSSVIGNYIYIYYTDTWTTPAGTVRVRITWSATDGAAVADGGSFGGMYLDDCAFWVTNQPIAKSWRPGTCGQLGTYVTAVNGYWTSYNWTCSDPAIGNADPTGIVKFQGTAATTGEGGYAEICTTEKDRPQIDNYHTYTISFWVWAADGGTIANCGVRAYNGNQLDKTIPNQSTGDIGGPMVTLTPETWTLVTSQVTTGPNTTNIEPYLRVYTNGATVYVDAASLIEGVPTALSTYTVDDSFHAVRDVTNYTSEQIGEAQTQSITFWGVREQEVSNDNVIDTPSLDALAISTLAAQAVPTIQVRLEVDGLTNLVQMDGLVQVGNLPQAPPALPAVRIQYRVDASVHASLDLNDERVSLDLLGRLMQERNI